MSAIRSTTSALAVFGQHESDQKHAKAVEVTTSDIGSTNAAKTAEKVIHVFLVGPGCVGGELLEQIQKGFSSDAPTEIRAIGLANSRVMHVDPNGIVLKNWKEQLAQTKEQMSLQKFIDKMVALKLPHSVFVDCTSSQEVADAYPRVLESRIAIVASNKKANSDSFPKYCKLRNLANQHKVKFLYDTNVGAGLPYIHAIKSIKRSGDSVVKLQAILSGTLSYLFNTFDGTVPFSKVLADAQQKGYTEPDPRDDLNGMDMARKFLILARESGLALELKDIVVKRFLPDDCFDAPSVPEFYKKLENYDKELSALAKEEAQKGKVLRFIGTLENGRATLSLEAVDNGHPFYPLSGTDNIGSIYSLFYSKNPIVIKGPGAGATVTAANVLSNIIQAVSND